MVRWMDVTDRFTFVLCRRSRSTFTPYPPQNPVLRNLGLGMRPPIPLGFAYPLEIRARKPF